MSRMLRFRSWASRSPHRSLVARHSPRLVPGVLAVVALGSASLAGCGSAAVLREDGNLLSSSPSAVPVPNGLPKNWSTLALSAATATLTACAQSNALTPANCPEQDSNAASGFATVEGVHWTLFGQPLAHALAIPAGQQGAVTGGSVEVYGLYQMDVSYTVSGQGIRPYMDYAGGIAHATMTWDGTSFQNVTFASSSNPLDQPPPGVTVIPFARPSQATDDAVLAAVRAGFQDCVSLPFPPSTPQIPNCPQASSTNLDAATAEYVENSDPMQGALVSFDTQHGDFAVTGSFDMNLNYTVNEPGAEADGAHTNRVAGNYTATVIWDGSGVQLLNIALA